MIAQKEIILEPGTRAFVDITNDFYPYDFFMKLLHHPYERVVTLICSLERFAPNVDSAIAERKEARSMKGILVFGVAAAALTFLLLLFRQWLFRSPALQRRRYPVYLILSDDGDWNLSTMGDLPDPTRGSVMRIKLPTQIMTFDIKFRNKPGKASSSRTIAARTGKNVGLIILFAMLFTASQVVKAQTTTPVNPGLQTSTTRSADQSKDAGQKESGSTAEPADTNKTAATDKKIADKKVSDQDNPPTAPVTTTTGNQGAASSQTPPASPAKQDTPARRGMPAPLDGVFPSTEYIGPTIGVPDTDPVYPLTKALWDMSPALKNAKIKVYGWVNPGYNASTSKNSNIPLTYSVVPNRVELDQAVLRVERVPDTVQTDHVDWGFRVSNMYGIDYRWTTAQGYFSGQLLHHNLENGWDPVELYGLLYFPHVAKGMVLKFGRYISPPDIEAQLAPDNYLYTHSIFFDYDAYTNTGIIASIMLNNQWTVQVGFHAGKDVAPWAAGAHPTFQALARWVSKSNNDSLYGGIASLNNGRFKGNLDNLNQFNLTWTHRFNEQGTILTTTESYFLQTSGAPVGGSVIDGPPRPGFTNVGIGTPIQGNAIGTGVVNYTVFKLGKRDFLTLRPIDIMVDKKGERSGFATTYQSGTIGLTHRFSDLFSVRPELRFEHAYTGKPYDNGTRRNQFTFGIDLIARF